MKKILILIALSICFSGYAKKAKYNTTGQQMFMDFRRSFYTDQNQRKNILHEMEMNKLNQQQEILNKKIELRKKELELQQLEYMLNKNKNKKK